MIYQNVHEIDYASVQLIFQYYNLSISFYLLLAYFSLYNTPLCTHSLFLCWLHPRGLLSTFFSLLPSEMRNIPLQDLFIQFTCSFRNTCAPDLVILAWTAQWIDLTSTPGLHTCFIVQTVHEPQTEESQLASGLLILGSTRNETRLGY